MKEINIKIYLKTKKKKRTKRLKVFHKKYRQAKKLAIKMFFSFFSYSLIMSRKSITFDNKNINKSAFYKKYANAVRYT